MNEPKVASANFSSLFNDKLVYSVFASGISCFLFTIGFFDALGLNLRLGFIDSSAFVFRITIANFASVVMKDWEVGILLVVSVISFISLFGRMKEKYLQARWGFCVGDWVNIVLLIIASTMLYIRSNAAFEERKLLIAMTFFVTLIPFFGIAVVQIRNGPIKAIENAILLTVCLAIISSYFIGAQVLHKNIKFPTVKISAKETRKWLKVWETENELFLISCNVNKSIQSWRWDGGAYKFSQIVVSDGSNSLTAICNRSSK